MVFLSPSSDGLLGSTGLTGRLCHWRWLLLFHVGLGESGYWVAQFKSKSFAKEGTQNHGISNLKRPLPVVLKTHHTCWNIPKASYSVRSIQFSCSVVSDSLWPPELQHARLPCPSPTLRACSNSCLSSRWCKSTRNRKLQEMWSAPRTMAVEWSI